MQFRTLLLQAAAILFQRLTLRGQTASVVEQGLLFGLQCCLLPVQFRTLLVKAAAILFQRLTLRGQTASVVEQGLLFGLQCCLLPVQFRTLLLKAAAFLFQRLTRHVQTGSVASQGLLFGLQYCLLPVQFRTLLLKATAFLFQRLTRHVQAGSVASQGLLFGLQCCLLSMQFRTLLLKAAAFLFQASPGRVGLLSLIGQFGPETLEFRLCSVEFRLAEVQFLAFLRELRVPFLHRSLALCRLGVAQLKSVLPLQEVREFGFNLVLPLPVLLLHPVGFDTMLVNVSLQRFLLVCQDTSQFFRRLGTLREFVGEAIQFCPAVLQLPLAVLLPLFRHLEVALSLGQFFPFGIECRLSSVDAAGLLFDRGWANVLRRMLWFWILEDAVQLLLVASDLLLQRIHLPPQLVAQFVNAGVGIQAGSSVNRIGTSGLLLLGVRFGAETDELLSGRLRQNSRLHGLANGSGQCSANVVPARRIRFGRRDGI